MKGQRQDYMSSDSHKKMTWWSKELYTQLYASYANGETDFTSEIVLVLENAFEQGYLAGLEDVLQENR